MSPLDSWLQPLRAYPPALVLAVFVLVAGAVTWGVAKLLKWSVYLFALVAFAGVTTAFVLWLFP